MGHERDRWRRGRRPSPLIPGLLIAAAVAGAATVAFAAGSDVAPSAGTSQTDGTTGDGTTTTEGTTPTTGSTTYDDGPPVGTTTSGDAATDTAGAPAGTQAGSAQPPATLPDVVIATPWVMPVVRDLAVSPRVVRVAGGRVRLAWVQSSAGPVALRLERLLPGRRLGTRCVAPAIAPGSARGCVRSARVRLRTVTGREGLNRVTLAGPGLARGRYRVIARPLDPGGNAGSSRTAGAVVR